MATTAGAGGDVHPVLYDAVAVCSASCAQRTTTNPTMKGAATPVTVGLDQAPQPHLTRLPIVSASASPTLRDGCTISWPPLTACSSHSHVCYHSRAGRLRGKEKPPLNCTLTGDRDLQLKLTDFKAIFTHRETIKFYILFKKLYIF